MLIVPKTARSWQPQCQTHANHSRLMYGTQSCSFQPSIGGFKLSWRALRSDRLTEADPWFFPRCDFWKNSPGFLESKNISGRVIFKALDFRNLTNPLSLMESSIYFGSVQYALPIPVLLFGGIHWLGFLWLCLTITLVVVQKGEMITSRQRRGKQKSSSRWWFRAVSSQTKDDCNNGCLIKCSKLFYLSILVKVFQPYRRDGSTQQVAGLRCHRDAKEWSKLKIFIWRLETHSAPYFDRFLPSFRWFFPSTLSTFIHSIQHGSLRNSHGREAPKSQRIQNCWNSKKLKVLQLQTFSPRMFEPIFSSRECEWSQWSVMSWTKASTGNWSLL